MFHSFSFRLSPTWTVSYFALCCCILSWCRQSTQCLCTIIWRYLKELHTNCYLLTDIFSSKLASVFSFQFCCYRYFRCCNFDHHYVVDNLHSRIVVWCVHFSVSFLFFVFRIWWISNAITKMINHLIGPNSTVVHTKNSKVKWREKQKK